MHIKKYKCSIGTGVFKCPFFLDFLNAYLAAENAFPYLDKCFKMSIFKMKNRCHLNKLVDIEKIIASHRGNVFEGNTFGGDDYADRAT